MVENFISKDYDLEFFYKKVVRFIGFYKLCNDNINKNFDINSLKIYVEFNNVVDLDSITINRYFFLIWLLSGKIPKISKIFSVYRLGVEYYFLSLELYLFNIYDICSVLNVLVNNLLLNKKNFKIGFNVLRNEIDLIFLNKSMFSNFKVAKNVFIYNISENINFQLSFKSQNEKNILYFVSKLLNMLSYGSGS